MDKMDENLTIASDDFARPTPIRLSVIGCTWPALALRLPERVPAPENASTRSLLEMAQLGHIPMPIGGIDQFRLETLENGDHRLNYR